MGRNQFAKPRVCAVDRKRCVDKVVYIEVDVVRDIHAEGNSDVDREGLPRSVQHSVAPFAPGTFIRDVAHELGLALGADIVLRTEEDTL